MASNPCAKKVTPEQAYQVYQDNAGQWTYFVLKHYQSEEKAKDNPFARYFCLVKSPIVPKGEYADCYRTTVLDGTHLITNPLNPMSGGQDDSHRPD